MCQQLINFGLGFVRLCQHIKSCFDAFLVIFGYVLKGDWGSRTSVMHFPKSFPSNAFVVALFLTLKAWGDEVELREE